MRILAKMGILTHISVLYKCNFSKSAKKKKRRRTHIGLLFEFQFEFQFEFLIIIIVMLTFRDVMVFILYKLYFLFPYPTLKPTQNFI